VTRERQVNADIDETGEETRREALAKMGKYAAYTAPALVALTIPDEGHAKGKGKGKGPRVHTSHRRY